ncbi:MAG: hypothetical protein IPH85_01570 [Ignavibacteria bacterium]|nr:hypothetical protein [Ignavibacteria bacterium]
MKKFLKFLSVVATIIVATTFSVSAQWFVGPAFTYSISTGLGEDVTAYGAPTRFNLGVRANKALASTSELYLGLNYRGERRIHVRLCCNTGYACWQARRG